MNNKVLFAERVAEHMHMGQVDKVGFPYIVHVREVAIGVKEAGGTDTEVIVAWLHDTVEDTPLTLTAIRSEFGNEVADAVDALTRRESESIHDYAERLLHNAVASKVKGYDILSNLAPNRTMYLTNQDQERLSKKYDYVLERLGIR